jgi:L-alanine-DL-glutamate epimerase-like enolase superfamily enzyme
MAIAAVEAAHYRIPLPVVLSDSTHGAMSSFELVTVRLLDGDGAEGVGYTYTVGAGGRAVAALVEADLTPALVGEDAGRIERLWQRMWWRLHYGGRGGFAALAISAVDIALWDLAAHVLDLPLCTLLGRCHDRVPIYGSGGFCSYSDDDLARQLGGWAADGIGRVKMKLGRDPDRDRERLAVARAAIGPDVELFVDANGAFDRDSALRWAEVYAEYGVRYFEEPVSSDDLQGLALLRDRAPAGMAIAAGEYGFDLPYFRAMVGVVGIQQADVTRCGGITGMARVGALCQAHEVPFSAHCAPAVSAHACAAIEPLAHLEYFHDHVRIESLLFDGTLSPDGGALEPDLGRAGLGLELRGDQIALYAVS